MKQANRLADEAENYLKGLDKPAGYVYSGGYVAGSAKRLAHMDTQDNLEGPVPEFVKDYVEQVVFGGHLTSAGIRKDVNVEIAAFRERLSEARSK